jgi:hypothetical protein
MTREEAHMTREEARICGCDLTGLGFRGFKILRFRV